MIVGIRFSLAQDLRLCLCSSLSLRKLLIQGGDLGQARSILVCNCPLSEEYITLVANLLIHYIISWEDSKTFQQRLVGERLLKSTTCILDESIQDGQSTNLTVRVAIFACKSKSRVDRCSSQSYIQLLSKSSCSFNRSSRLDTDDINQIDDTAEIVFFKLLTC